MIKRVLVAGSLTLALAACGDRVAGGPNRHLAPIPPATLALMSAKGVSPGDPILVRIHKKESELELYKRGRDGRYALLKTYPICRWSGQLGPKQREGDRQAPEGFYTVTPAQMNPDSSLYLSFDLGYPNAYDRSHGRSGSHLMVHGSCSSAGCYAMTDEAISEVYALAREAFAGGQRGFQVQALPFRMTPENLAKHRADSRRAATSSTPPASSRASAWPAGATRLARAIRPSPTRWPRSRRGTSRRSRAWSARACRPSRSSTPTAARTSRSGTPSWQVRGTWAT
jgi:hypothetical protein